MYLCVSSTQGTNGVFEYYFADAVERPFDIDASTGIVTLVGTLDFDSGPTEYSFNVSFCT